MDAAIDERRPDPSHAVESVVACPAKAVPVAVASRLAQAFAGAEIRARAERRDPHGLARG
jgi:hypothetical protein